MYSKAGVYFPAFSSVLYEMTLPILMQQKEGNNTYMLEM